MRHLVRGRDGYIDPVMSVLPIATLLIWFANPRIVAMIATGSPDGLPAWLRIVAISAVAILVQGVAVAVCLAEARQDAQSGGERSGFNRAPALQGLAAPLGLALVYLIGLWPLMRMEPGPMWAVVLNVIVVAAIVGGGLMADKKGGERRPQRADPPTG